MTNQILVVAGYGGGSTYRKTAEILDITGWRPDQFTSDGAHKQNSSTLFRPLPHELSQPRTGCVGGFGPQGSFYCCGGSTDGGNAVSILERLDLREAKGFELRAPWWQEVTLVVILHQMVDGEWWKLFDVLRSKFTRHHWVRPQSILNSIEYDTHGPVGNVGQSLQIDRQTIKWKLLPSAQPPSTRAASTSG